MTQNSAYLPTTKRAFQFYAMDIDKSDGFHVNDADEKAEFMSDPLLVKAQQLALNRRQLASGAQPPQSIPTQPRQQHQPSSQSAATVATGVHYSPPVVGQLLRQCNSPPVSTTAHTAAVTKPLSSQRPVIVSISSFQEQKQSIAPAMNATSTKTNLPGPSQLQNKQPAVVVKDDEKKSSALTAQHINRKAVVAAATGTGNLPLALSTDLDHQEIADLKRYHDNSLSASTRKAYLSDYQNFTEFLVARFPDLKLAEVKARCTLEHVLAYLNQLCNDGRTISTINRRLSTIKKHILPSLFRKTVTPGSREEVMLQEMEAIVRGMRRTIAAEQPGIRGKKPLLIEDIRKMAGVAEKATDEAGNAMPNKRCRDVSLILFLFFSAMRRSEVEKLMWSDLNFDKRGVTVLIRQSKTDKESKGQTIAISRVEDTATGTTTATATGTAAPGVTTTSCPVKALELWKDKSGGVGESPVFKWISKKDEIQWRVLTDQRIVAIVKDYCKKVGLDETAFSAHSTRSGFVTSSSERGVPIAEIMKRTRHKSLSSVGVYMKSEDLFKGAPDRKM